MFGRLDMPAFSATRIGCRAFDTDGAGWTDLAPTDFTDLFTGQAIAAGAVFVGLLVQNDDSANEVWVMLRADDGAGVATTHLPRAKGDALPLNFRGVGNDTGVTKIAINKALAGSTGRVIAFFDEAP